MIFHNIIKKYISWNNKIDNLSSTTEILQELQVTLEALGYENRAINQVIKILITDESLLNILELEQWLKRAIIYLDS